MRGNKNKKMKNEEKARSLFGISLTGRPRWQQFVICSSGFFFGYLVNGICEVIPISLSAQFCMYRIGIYDCSFVFSYLRAWLCSFCLFYGKNGGKDF